MLFGSLLSNPSASSVLWLILISSPSSLWVLLSHLPFSLFSTSLSSLTGKSLTLPQQRVSAHAHTRKACCLATQGWDRCRPIREASERAVNGEREPIDRRVPLHINLQQWGFNHFLTFGSLSDQTEPFHPFTDCADKLPNSDTAHLAVYSHFAWISVTLQNSQNNNTRGWVVNIFLKSLKNCL